MATSRISENRPCLAAANLLMLCRIDRKSIFESLSLTTEMQFSTDLSLMSNQPQSFHSFISSKIRGFFMFLKFGQKRGVMKKLLRDRGLVESEGGGVLLERGGFQIVS